LLFQQRLNDLIDQPASTASPFALLLVDVDEFKQVNDTLGHDAGDQLLCTVAKRLSAAVRSDDLVARLGGDEFALLLKDVANPIEVQKVCEKVITELKRPFVHAGRALDCQASIGVAIYGNHGSTAGELLKNADVALYVAKQRGRARTTLFAPHMRANVQKRLRMVEVARQAIREHLFVPYYQPQVNLRTGETVGFEALLRVRHPTRGLLAPVHVSAALEDLDLAAEIGDRMTQLVVGDVSSWLQNGIEIGHVALNAAAADFRRGDFAERLLRQLDRYKVPPEKIQVEVTETVFIGRGAEYVGRALRDLSRCGVRIALDDFGTGYASLSHLQQFPIDVIKIDRSFVGRLTKSSNDIAIVRAILTLGKSLGLDVIAEGIEEAAEEAQLKAEGCQFGQGFLFGKPMPAARVANKVGRYRSAA
jgi:diguanylate cyclase (GGDEF)-like protein